MADDGFILMNIRGWKELADQLEALGDDKEIRATMRKALKKVAEPAVAYARSLAPKKFGRYAAKIKVGSTLTKRQRRGRPKTTKTEAEVFFGPQGSTQGFLIEFGTAPRYHKSGKYVGAVRPQPHMRPAWEAFKFRMLTEFGAELGKQLERSAARIARRQAKLIRESKR